MNSNSQKQPFNFFDNSFCLSVSNKVLNGRVEQDLLVEGDTETLMKALVENMHRHQVLAEFITNAGYLYMLECQEKLDTDPETNN